MYCWGVIYYAVLIIQEPLCSLSGIHCANNVTVDSSNCLKPCTGLIVTSYSKSNEEMDLEKLFPFLKAYDKYKKLTPFPSGYYGNITYYF